MIELTFHSKLCFNMENKTVFVQIAKFEEVQKLENYPFLFFFQEQFDKQMVKEMGNLKGRNVCYQLVSMSQGLI